MRKKQRDRQRGRERQRQMINRRMERLEIIKNPVKGIIQFKIQLYNT